MKNHITVKQKKLIELYLETGNIAKAAKEAGYESRQAAHYFLTNHDMAKQMIKDGYQTFLARKANRHFEVLKQAQLISSQLLEEGDYKSAVKALEFEAKLLRMFDSEIIRPTPPNAGLEHYDLSKLNIEELELLKSLLAKSSLGDIK